MSLRRPRLDRSIPQWKPSRRYTNPDLEAALVLTWRNAVVPPPPEIDLSKMAVDIVRDGGSLSRIFWVPC